MEQYILVNRTTTDDYRSWGPFPTEQEATAYQTHLTNSSSQTKGTFFAIPLTQVAKQPA